MTVLDLDCSRIHNLENRISYNKPNVMPKNLFSMNRTLVVKIQTLKYFMTMA
jgi:hypothetical protein